ncbi:MAG TPA: hypothetical protein VIL74_07510 [Pyrinomonadaceae bacterium]|jgi:hypothetical protein
MKKRSQFIGIEKSYKKLLPESKEKIDYLISVLRRALHDELQRTQEQRKVVKSANKG